MLKSELKSRLRSLEGKFPRTELLAIEAWAECFFPFQLDWLFDFSLSSLLVKSRQIGGTFTYAAWAALLTMLGETTHIVSTDGDDSKKFLLMVDGHLSVLEQLGCCWAKAPRHRFRRIVGDALYTRTGGRVFAHTSQNPARGMTGNVILDECAYYEHPELSWDAAVAAMMHGGRLRIISTPNGAQGLFFEESEKSQHRQFRTTLEDARRDGMVVPDAVVRTIDRGDPRIHRQVFCCSFNDASEQYVPSDLIKACTVDELWSEPSWDAYAGLDIGRSADLTVLVVVRISPMGVAHVVHVECLKRTITSDLYRLAATALNQYRSRRLCVDATGMGSFPAEELERRYPHRVESVNFSLNSKEDLATGMYDRFSKMTVKLPSSERDLASDVAALRRIITSAGNVRYDAAHTNKGHADRAWALALALHGCSRPPNVRHEIGPVATQQQLIPPNGGRVVYR